MRRRTGSPGCVELRCNNDQAGAVGSDAPLSPCVRRKISEHRCRFRVQRILFVITEVTAGPLLLVTRIANRLPCAILFQGGGCKLPVIPMKNSRVVILTLYVMIRGQSGIVFIMNKMLCVASASLLMLIPLSLAAQGNVFHDDEKYQKLKTALNSAIALSWLEDHCRVMDASEKVMQERISLVAQFASLFGVDELKVKWLKEDAKEHLIMFSKNFLNSERNCNLQVPLSDLQYKQSVVSLGKYLEEYKAKPN